MNLIDRSYYISSERGAFLRDTRRINLVDRINQVRPYSQLNLFSAGIVQQRLNSTEQGAK